MRTSRCCFLLTYFVVTSALEAAAAADVKFGKIELHLEKIEESPSRSDASLLKQSVERNLSSDKIPRSRRYIIWSRKLNGSEECGSSSEDFPTFFTERQMQRGGIILVVLLGIYCFTLLAIICDNYFLPCVEKICEALNLSHDVAAATFMSIATSAPELFVNIIGTFITESDIGIGTVVGSSLFNTLGVASLGGLAAAKPVQLHWWPITRDVIIYIMAILLLVSITWDGMIFWYEGLILFIVYFFYFLFMFNNARVSNFIKKLYKKLCKKQNQNKVADCEKAVEANNTPHGRVSVAVISSYGSYAEEPLPKYTDSKFEKNAVEEEKVEEVVSLFKIPKGSIWKKLFFFYTWPIKFALFCTIPDPQKFPKLFPVTFVLCIFWIGSNSYVISWMIAVMGNMFKIPDAVLGLTFLAAGGCLPEAISITIMSRRGEGSMGVSNSLGANTMNILLSLGMPWFLKTILMGTNDKSFIAINSGSIEYTISALIPIAVVFYLTFFFNKFQLSRNVGIILITIYVVCIILAILSEMVFFEPAFCSPYAKSEF